MQDVTLGTARSEPADISNVGRVAGRNEDDGGWLNSDHLGITGWQWIGVLVAIACGLLLLLGVWCCFRSMRKRHRRAPAQHTTAGQSTHRSQSAAPRARPAQAPPKAQSHKNPMASARNSVSGFGKSLRGSKQPQASAPANGRAAKGGRKVGANPFLSGFGADRADANMAAADAHNPYVIEELE